MNATKQQLIDFIMLKFVLPDGEHPTRSQLEVFKKDELVEVIMNSSAESDLLSYINSLS